MSSPSAGQMLDLKVRYPAFTATRGTVITIVRIAGDSRNVRLSVKGHQSR